MRLWTRRSIDELDGALLDFERALVDLAERDGTAVLPGTTHIQPAQPVLFAHHLLAYVEMAERDRGRLADARARLNVSPLGSGALAGAGYPLDREATAAELGFDGVSANSLDAVSDRDFVVETLAAIALGMVHLSRLAEEITWWSNPRFGFVRVADAFSTGSSMMPNKKNPDPAELVRGRAARVIGELTGSLTLLKGLPLAYQRDLQESVAPLFDAVAVYETSLRVMAGLVGTLTIDAAADGRRRQARATRPRRPWPTRWSAAASPFRTAHHIVGSLVAQAEAAGIGLDAVPDAMIGLALGASGDTTAAGLAEDADLGDELRAAASIDGALASADVIGGTAPTRVATALAAATRQAGGGGLVPARTIGRHAAIWPPSSRRPRPCSTTISMAGCDRPRSSTWRPSTATPRCRPPTSTTSRPGSGGAPIARASSSTSRRSPTRSGSCSGPTRSPGSRPSAPRTSPPTAWSTPRSGWRPSCAPSRG